MSLIPVIVILSKHKTMKLYTKLIVYAIFVFIASNVLGGNDPQIKVSANGSTQIQVGDSISISWEATNAKEVFCYEYSNQPMEVRGSITVSPEQLTTYTFTAVKGKKSKRKKITIDILYPGFARLTIPDTISDEKASSFSWEAANAEYVKIEGFDDSFTPSGKFPLKSTNDTVITLTAVNKNGREKSISQKVNIKYEESFYYSKRISIGSTAQIQWKFKNTEKVKIVDISDSLPRIGEINFPLLKTTDFKMFVYRDEGILEIKNFSIVVYKSEILMFKSQRKVLPGEEATLMWDVRDADSVKLSVSDKNQAIKGSYKYTPLESEVVTLTSYLNGFADVRETKVDIIRRKYITGETDYTALAHGVRLDYEIFSIDLSEFPDIVKLYVLVVDTAGNFVHGLAPPTISEQESSKYFVGLVESYTGGGSQSITDFKVEENKFQPVKSSDISLVLDYSGSMQNAIGDLETSAKSFIDNKLDGDRISLVRFDGNVVQEIGLTKDKSAILNTVKFNGLDKFGGSTALYAAMSDGITSLEENPNAKNEMLLFTDGCENSSMFYLGKKAVTAQEVADFANDKSVRINIISFGEGVNTKLLEVLSSYTGGNYYPVMSSKEINGVWTELPYLKRNFYTITFKTNDLKKIDGIKLKYADNTGKTNFAKRDLYMNTPVDFYEYEGGEDSYWMKYLKTAGNLKPISTPQVLALFGLNGRIVLNEYLPKVDTLVSFMNSDSTISAMLFGHTDQSDTDEYNDKLSAERCRYIKSYLISRGIDEKRIFIVALGESAPIWKEENEDWKSLENRRVEVLFLK